MLRFLSLFALLGLATLTTAVAAPPSWLQEALKADTTEWKQSSGSVVLLESESVQYLAPDRVRRKIRTAVRVTQEAGRSDTFASLVYNADTERIRAARAWVIAPDGKQIDVYDRPQFVDAAATYSRYVWNAQRVIAFSGAAKLAINAVLAWEFEVEAESGIFDTSWSFLSPRPVVRSVFEVTPMPSGKLVWHGSSGELPAPVAGSSAGAFVWEMRRIPAPPREEPSGFLPNPMRISVRCLPASGEDQSRSWSDLVRRVTEVIEPRIVADPTVKALAEKLTAGAADRWARIRAVTEFVQRDVPYLSLTLDKDSLAGYRPHLPAEVLQRRLGDCKDKATLVAALLRSLGDQAYVVLVHAQNPRALDPEWPSAFFNHAIVGIVADNAVPAHWPTIDAGPVGSLVLFDATDPATPLGVLPPVDQGGYGLVVAAGIPGLVQLPVVAPEHNERTREVTATLDASGQLQAKVSEHYRGSVAATEHDARFELRDDEYRHRLERRLAATMPTAALANWTERWERVSCEYQLELELAAERYGRWVGRDMMLVSPRLFASYAALPPWKVVQDGVAWIPPQQLRNAVRLQLPEGFTVTEVPRPWRSETPHFTCALRYRLEGRELIHESEVTRRTGVLTKADYDALRIAYQKFDDAERRPVVLRRAAPAAAAVNN